jgi:predicted nucleotide-binding protein
VETDMAHKPPGAKASKSLSPSEKQSAIPRLEARIVELRDLVVANLQRGDDQPVTDLGSRIRSTLANIYGQDSAEYDRLQIAAKLDTTNYLVELNGRRLSQQEIQQGVDRGRRRALSTLQGEVDALKEDLHFSAPASIAVSTSAPTPAELSDEIFVVHGRDDAAKEQVAAVIQRAGLTPIILHQQANEGKTIIEKFEKHGSAAGFAVVIATPDDVGGLAAPSPLQADLKPRARQNVIGEMFWFAGRLDREKVCTLVKGISTCRPTSLASDIRRWMITAAGRPSCCKNYRLPGIKISTGRRRWLRRWITKTILLEISSPRPQAGSA